MFLEEGDDFFEVENILKCEHAPTYKTEATVCSHWKDGMALSLLLSRGPQRDFEAIEVLNLFKKEDDFSRLIHDLAFLLRL